MTTDGESYLNRLSESIVRLQRLTEGQRTILQRQWQEIEILTDKCKELQRQLDEEKERKTTLLTARMIVADDNDWQEAYQRLLVLQKEIQEAIRLLELG